jgi:hypothetical protein
MFLLDGSAHRPVFCLPNAEQIQKSWMRKDALHYNALIATNCGLTLKACSVCDFLRSVFVTHGAQMLHFALKPVVDHEFDHALASQPELAAKFANGQCFQFFVFA